MEYIETPIHTERKPITDYTLKIKIERLKRRLEKKLLARTAADLLIEASKDAPDHVIENIAETIAPETMSASIAGRAMLSSQRLC